MPNMDKSVLMKAAELAEKKCYEQALGLLEGYLKENPSDPEALNDAGTVLYCLHRGREAIAYFQKARQYSSGDMLAQVLFNLCETYLAERQPEQAVGLLDEMASHEILNADTINRIANCFVEKNAFGPAIEMLLYSLRLAPNQEILHPMIEIIRSKRSTLVLFAEQNKRLEGLREYLEARYPVQVCTGGQLPSMPQGGSERSVSIFAGISRVLLEGRFQNGPAVVILDYEDLNRPEIEQVDWKGIRALFVPSEAAAQQIRLRLGQVPSSLQILSMGPAVEVETLPLPERRKGKRLAAVGPWTAYHNPMFLLQCMQKLHYLDPDMRLHLVGEFEDETIRAYVETLIEAMGLENAVILDGVPRSWPRWLKDKHYIVSTAVDGRAMPAVLQGMAAGLRPVVHQFPGVCEYVEKEFVFVLAEDFCRQILEGPYEPLRYREWVVNRCCPVQVYLPLVRVLSNLEHQISMRLGGKQKESGGFEQPPAAVPRPLAQKDLIGSNGALETSSKEPMPTAAFSESIEELARKALEAAQRLSEGTEIPQATGADYSGSGRSLSAAPF